MLDSHIRKALVDRIRQDHSDPVSDRIWSEFAVCIGAARVDLCLVNGSLSGYEIKSPKDNLDRLPRQVEQYGKVLDYATIVTTKKHLQRARTAVPQWWGILSAAETDTGIEFKVERIPKHNRRTDPYSLAQLLWRDEAYEELLLRHLHHGLSRATRWVIWDQLVENLSKEELSQVVRDRLKARPARTADSRLGPDAVTSL